MNYASQLINSKGKMYAFDDLHCTTAFIKSGIVKKQDIGEVYVADFITEEMLNVKNAFFLRSAELRTPMNGAIAAFKNMETLQTQMGKYPGDVVTWEEIINR